MYIKKYLKYKYKYLILKYYNIIGGSCDLDTRIKLDNIFINHILMSKNIKKKDLLHLIYDKIKSDYKENKHQQFIEAVKFIGSQIFSNKSFGPESTDKFSLFYLTNHFEKSFFKLHELLD